MISSLRHLRLGWWLLLLPLLLSGPLAAQPNSPRYWRANYDSLTRVLARQTADTARLRTLHHLFSLRYSLPQLQTITELSARLHRPEYPAYRAWLAGDAMPGVWPDLGRVTKAAQAAALDSLRLSNDLFDALQWTQTQPLGNIYQLYLVLDRHQQLRAYFEPRLASYHAQGSPRKEAASARALAGSYLFEGEYDQAISYLLQAATIYQYLGESYWYYNELGVIGSAYADWGNYAQAQVYLTRSLRARDAGILSYTYRSLVGVYLHQHNDSAALRAANQALQLSQPLPRGTLPGFTRACALVLKCQVLLAQHRVAEAGTLLPVVQHLADSLSLPLYTSNGDLELAATWARYYAARHEPARAEAAWRLANYQAQHSQSAPLRLAYARALAAFYVGQGRPALAAPYALAALAQTDALAATQGRFHLAHYEREQAARIQASRIARLRQAQTQATARAHRQRTQVQWLLAGAAALGLLALLQTLNYRRQRQTNALLAHQQAQLTQQAARLGELDAAKNQFFANVSHELRTPLTLLLGPLDALLAGSPRPLPAFARPPVALALRQAQRLAELVNRILDLTKLQAGQLALQPVPTVLAPLLCRVVAQFESLAAQRQVALLGPAALPEGQGPHLLVDADKVEQILTNLLINALNHTPAGGTVHLAGALPGPDGYYALTVRDTGPGIAPAEQARIFERFYQAPQSHAQGGTGLGLALSRELAQLLGGTLTVASEPGQGAAFTLHFPAAALPAVALGPAGPPTKLPPLAAPSRPAAPAPRHAAAPSRPRVLVAEDQPELRQYLTQLLHPYYEVLQAADGQEALVVLTDEQPVDLLITDAMMPRLSGLELLAQLRANPYRAGLPVLMLTARADEPHRLAALTVGVDDYLTKPFTTAELLARARALLERQQVRQYFATLPAAEPDEAPDEAPAPDPAAPLAAEPNDPPAPAATAQAAWVDTASMAVLRATTQAAAQLAGWQQLAHAQLAAESFGPAELARLVGLSERTLYRRLGELAGLTPAAWLRELRLHEARHLLEAGGFSSVADVADAVGFASSKYFATLYAERFGRRPADYRP